MLVIALAAAVIGAVLLVVGLRAQESAPQPRDVGTINPPPASAHDPGPVGDKRTPGPLGPSRPTRLDIPALGIHTPVNELGLAPDGTLAVPQPGPHLNQAAWFRNSPSPGQPGPSVIEGHVDSVEGPSIFFRLGAIKPGDKVRVHRADGVRLVFVVDAVRDFAKAHFPTRLVYGGAGGRPTLRLITCSDFNTTTHHHEGNEVVFTHLARVRRPS